MRAGLIGTRYVSRGVAPGGQACGDDLAAEVAAVAAALEGEYTDERLERLVRASGMESG